MRQLIERATNADVNADADLDANANAGYGYETTWS